ncbi:MAG: hypothetical protein M5U28_05555 [Sandaracinaceae bacterium]|nr:hypothetical protein [Sandaracinaceae bacterium]
MDAAAHLPRALRLVVWTELQGAARRGLVAALGVVLPALFVPPASST